MKNIFQKKRTKSLETTNITLDFCCHFLFIIKIRIVFKKKKNAQIIILCSSYSLSFLSIESKKKVWVDQKQVLFCCCFLSSELQKGQGPNLTQSVSRNKAFTHKVLCKLWQLLFNVYPPSLKAGHKNNQFLLNTASPYNLYFSFMTFIIPYAFGYSWKAGLMLLTSSYSCAFLASTITLHFKI